MFSTLFTIITFELLASMGTFGALVAQHVYTNSAAGWYVRLDWTVIYTYIVTIFSTIISFFILVGGLTRGTPNGVHYCTCLFHPFMLFVFSFIFSVLWVVIAGFAYRNPLPMKYPCGVFRHLRTSLEMLGLSSGKSLVEEGGLLVGICQSSKAFLVFTGIGLSLWVLTLVLSCAGMTAGLGKPKKADVMPSSRRSIRSVLTGHLYRDPYVHSAPAPAPQQYAISAPGPVSGHTHPPQASCCHRNQPSNSGSRIAAGYVPARIQRNIDFKADKGYGYGAQKDDKRPGGLQQPPQGVQEVSRNAVASNKGVADKQRQHRPSSPTSNDAAADVAVVTRRSPGFAGPADALASDAHEDAFSPRSQPANNTAKRHRVSCRACQGGAIDDDEGEGEGDDGLDGPDGHDESGLADGGCHRHQYHSYDDGESFHHHASHSPPHSQSSRRQRLRHLFSRDPASQP
ncbi:hypothetical protein GGI12_000834 [Dipsacomyces acuminosporus]|nr:hypothetical protein GGI12_000834 [Dipsacomyces acuminosporus]